MFFYSLYGLLLVFVYALFKNAISLPSFNGLVGTFYIGAIATGLGFVFWIKAMASGKTSMVANLAYLTPFSFACLHMGFAWGKDCY